MKALLYALLFLFFAILSAKCQEPPHPEFTMEYYPKAVMPGDTLYIVITAKNPHPEPILVREKYFTNSSKITTYLKDSKSQVQPLLFERSSPFDDQQVIRLVEMEPGGLRIAGIETISVPPLEDLKEPFWEEH